MMNNGARNGQSAGLSIAEDIRYGMTSWAPANALKIGSGHVDNKSASQSTAQTATSSTSNMSAVIRSLMVARLDLLSQNRSRNQRSRLTRRKSSERGSDASGTVSRPGYQSRQSVCATPLSKVKNAQEEESTTLLAVATHALQIAQESRAALEANHGMEHQVSVVVKEVEEIIGGKTFEK